MQSAKPVDSAGQEGRLRLAHTSQSTQEVTSSIRKQPRQCHLAVIAVSKADHEIMLGMHDALGKL